MKSLRTGFGLLAAALTCVAASPAAAEELVPPENSAVDQYTEAFPTSRGGRDVHRDRRSKPSPRKVLGAENARKLEQQGKDGKAVVAIAAETAPIPQEEAVVPPVTEEPVADDDGAGGAARGGDGPGAPLARKPVPAITPPNIPAAEGSSGFTEVIARATGSSTGGTGILLPLFIVGTILWAFAYAFRQRRPAN